MVLLSPLSTPKEQTSKSISGFHLQRSSRPSAAELGHGSNLSRLETTATFIKETDEWEINNTTFTASKWWIGGLGALCTMLWRGCSLTARATAHTFVVPLRSLEDHKPFPGIEVGDIGPKAYNGFNGFARFTKYRIPRENMLMRFSKMSRDGVFTKPPHAKVSMTTCLSSITLFNSVQSMDVMTYLSSICPSTKTYQCSFRMARWSCCARVLIKQMSFYLSRATTVATRNLTVRRQFNNPTARNDTDINPGLEIQVINYPMVQNRLFPMITQAYAHFAAGSVMMEMYINLMTNLSSGVGRSLAHLFASIVPSNTYEGDNYVLTQQMARYLLKEVKTARTNSEKVTPFSKYLLFKSAFERTTCPVAQPEDWLNPEIQLAAYEPCARLAFELSDAVDAAEADPANPLTWSDHNIECYRVSHAHAQYTMVLWFIQAIRDAQNPETDLERRAEPTSIKVLKRLSHLHALHTIQTNLAD
ncbi:acyl-coenzyme A oxidase [Modicella reniformis]|uniref:Acyl-coenzyme A oxidase n=1 Tax=Modicella reniformis TaxID=1440133 RepID=A0A9P6MLG3_9FUNG|nr:acyl-coenzyme A oxidase [Modicella reniformis]